MSTALAFTLAALGFVGAFVAGLIGVGGGVLTFPLLLYVPPLLGMGDLDPKTVAAITVTQVFFACISGAVAHGRSGQLSRPLAITAGLFTTAGAFVGGVASKVLPHQVFLGLFGGVATLATVMIMLPGITDRAEGPLPLGRTAAVGLTVGGIVGILGAGNFLFIPLAVLFLRVPLRLAIGTNMVVAAVSSFGGFVGKAITGQIPFLAAVVVVLGALPGAQVGEWVCRRLNIQALRAVYAAIVGLVAVRVWLSILVP